MRPECDIVHIAARNNNCATFTLNAQGYCKLIVLRLGKNTYLFIIYLRFWVILCFAHRRKVCYSRAGWRHAQTHMNTVQWRFSFRTTLTAARLSFLFIHPQTKFEVCVQESMVGCSVSWFVNVAKFLKWTTSEVLFDALQWNCTHDQYQMHVIFSSSLHFPAAPSTVCSFVL